MPPLNGGIGTAVADLAPALVANGIHLTIVGVYPPSLLRENPLSLPDRHSNFTVLRLPSPWTRLPFRWRLPLERRTLRRFLIRHLRHSKTDAILADDYDGWLPIPPTSTLPLITRLNGSNLVYDHLIQRTGHPALHQSEQRMLQSSRAWIGVSRFFLDATTSLVPPPPSLITTVIPNAIDAQAFAPLPPTETIPGRIVFHNSLTPRKGLQNLLQAFAQIIPIRPDTTLFLCGSAPNPDWLEKQLSALPPLARQAITLTGRIDRQSTLQNILGRAAVACYPSHLETFGLSPVEAMAMQRVTLYADCGPAREVIRDGIDGFITPVANPSALAEKLLQALALNPDQRQAIGQAARSTVLHRFDRPIVARQMTDFLRSVIAPTSSR